MYIYIYIIHIYIYYTIYISYYIIYTYMADGIIVLFPKIWVASNPSKLDQRHRFFFATGWIHSPCASSSVWTSFWQLPMRSAELSHVSEDFQDGVPTSSRSRISTKRCYILREYRYSILIIPEIGFGRWLVTHPFWPKNSASNGKKRIAPISAQW